MSAYASSRMSYVAVRMLCRVLSEGWKKEPCEADNTSLRTSHLLQASGIRQRVCHACNSPLHQLLPCGRLADVSRRLLCCNSPTSSMTTSKVALKVSVWRPKQSAATSKSTSHVRGGTLAMGGPCLGAAAKEIGVDVVNGDLEGLAPEARRLGRRRPHRDACLWAQAVRSHQLRRQPERILWSRAGSRVGGWTRCWRRG